MTKQQRYDNYFLNRAFEASGMSYCKRLQVGAIAVRDNRTVLDGWNGTIHGTENCCEEKTLCTNCDNSGNFYTEYTGRALERQKDCTVCNGSGFVTRTKKATIHAERNIIFYAARKGIPLEGVTMYITHAPCIGCAQAMAAAGVAEVVYKDDYKSTEGVDFLKSININVRKVNYAKPN